ncbi:uncharacterized protein DUF4138 [Chitinophaga polysaccharea]|uniref:Uncharacterized protein DUF4138 n=1 Tax=Chitinophaga polysaccharea TaxID=1293035 RepID=A0A561P0V3_9BACT|nr:DUF4138 domain-containing protein [Chitinophaga polysaccharea]TWF31753.1 uncharacterized protein DUF4138 [Chitinophaga polysaccharea]
MIRTVLLLVLLLSCTYSRAQDNPIIPVSRNKTTFILIYNTKVVSANIGGRKGAIDNEQQITDTDTLTIIKLQAAIEDFTGTNMLVVCKDTVMEFSLVWQRDPVKTRYPYRYNGSVMNITPHNIINTTGAAPVPVADSIRQNGITIPAESIQRMQAAGRLTKRRIKDQGLVFILDDVGVDGGGHHFFRLRLRNTTAVAYSIEYVKFIVASPKRSGIGSSSAAVQDEYPPYLSAPDNSAVIGAGEEKELIYAVAKLPLSGQQLEIIMKEQAENSRGRTMTLKVPASVLTNKHTVVRL